jgi:NADH:ubiquinone oxidoreductase subunit F (NADH-binding)
VWERPTVVNNVRNHCTKSNINEGGEEYAKIGGQINRNKLISACGNTQVSCDMTSVEEFIYSDEWCGIANEKN